MTEGPPESILDREYFLPLLNKGHREEINREYINPLNIKHKLLTQKPNSQVGDQDKTP